MYMLVIKIPSYDRYFTHIDVCFHRTYHCIYFSEVNHETLNILKYVRPGGGFVPKFPVFGKVEVNGLNEDPLFTYLKVT